MPKSRAPGKCICCASSVKRNKAQLVFDEYGKFRRIQFLLAECVNKVVTEESESQHVICSDCLNQLDQSYAFKLKCTAAPKEISDESDDESNDGVSVNEECILPITKFETVEEIKCSPYNSPGRETVVNEDIKFEADTYDTINNIELLDDLLEDATPEEFDQDTDENIIESDEQHQVDIEYIDNTTKTINEENSIESPVDASVVHDDIEMLYEDEGSIEYMEVKDDFSGADSSDTNEVEYLESIEDGIDSENLLTVRTSHCEVPFVETLTVHSIKEKIREGIPTHRSSEPAPTPISTHIMSNNSLKAQGLMNVEIQLSEYAQHDAIDIDEYVMAIVSVSFCEFTPFVEEAFCKLCSEDTVFIGNFTFLLEHTLAQHRTEDEQLQCCLGPCDSFNNQAELNNHYFLQHGDIINAYTFLSCQTCEMGTESLVKFGKHVCSASVMSEPPVDNKYTCKSCNANLVSRRRSLFHQQFHLETPRPKVCLVCETVFRDEKTFYEHVMFVHEEFLQHFCRYCDKSFTIESELHRHEYRHTAVRSFVCNDCDKAFFDQQSLSTHNLIHQPGFNCEYCKKHFNRKPRLRKHMLNAHVVHSSAVLTVCDRCGQTFENAEASNRHWNLSHADEASAPQVSTKLSTSVYCCEFCEVAYMDVQQLSQHKSTHEAAVEKYECQYCPATYSAYSRLKTHCNSHADVQKPYPVKRLYVCDVGDCYKPYSDWRNFQNHRKTVHLINPSLIRCEQCDEVFYKSWNYAYHLKSVHAERKQCPYCKQTFVLERSLEEHISKQHLKEGEADRAVNLRRSSKHDDLVRKYFRIEPNGEFSCLKCEKVISRRNNAVAHVKMMHLNIKEFQCEVCSKEFFHRGDLNTHMRLHNLEKPYKCSICDHSTRSKSMLNTHMRKHTNERPYKCDECPKAFKRLLVLNNHKTLHGPKEYQCDQCEMAFYTKDTLRGHCKAKHEIDASQESVPKSKTSKKKKKIGPPSTIIVMYGSTMDPDHPDEPPISTDPNVPDPPKVYRLKSK